MRWIAEPAFDAHAPFVLQRIEVVNRLEARRFGVVIDAAYVGEEIELKRRVFFQESTEVDDLLRLDGKGSDTMRGAEILDCSREAPDDRLEIDTPLPGHDATTRPSGDPVRARDLLIFS